MNEISRNKYDARFDASLRPARVGVSVEGARLKRTQDSHQRVGAPINGNRTKNSVRPPVGEDSGAPPEELNMADTIWRIYLRCPIRRTQHGVHDLARPLAGPRSKNSTCRTRVGPSTALTTERVGQSAQLNHHKSLIMPA